MKSNVEFIEELLISISRERSEIIQVLENLLIQLKEDCPIEEKSPILSQVSKLQERNIELGKLLAVYTCIQELYNRLDKIEEEVYSLVRNSTLMT